MMLSYTGFISVNELPFPAVEAALPPACVSSVVVAEGRGGTGGWSVVHRDCVLAQGCVLLLHTFMCVLSVRGHEYIGEEAAAHARRKARVLIGCGGVVPSCVKTEGFTSVKQETLLLK